MENHSAGRKHKITPYELLSTAWHLFEAKGFHETTMAEVAEAAGLSRRSIFNYFSSKEALLFPMESTEAFIESFREKLLARPKSEKLFDSMRVVLGEMAPESANLATESQPGPEVSKARQTEAAIKHARDYWSAQMKDIALDRLREDPNAEIKAGFVGALTGQVLSELAALQKANGGKLKPNQAVTQVIGSLQDLFG